MKNDRYEALRRKGEERRQALKSLLSVSSSGISIEFDTILQQFKSISEVLTSPTGGLDSGEAVIKYIQKMGSGLNM